jgi:hypothetical protein
MSKLSRITQLLFGSTAGIDQIAQFGSFASGTPAFTTDPSQNSGGVQSLPIFLEGWFGAILGGDSPAIEDMNAIQFLFSRQLAYLMQAGVAEWDNATTYYIGSRAQVNGVVYSSITNNNINHAVTDSSNWLAPTCPGVLTVNSLPFTAGMTVPANESMTWPNLEIGSGQAVVVPSNANLIGITNITVSGTGILQATGTGVIRVL